ncbi:DUF6284 family protein [Streptomyces hydrogenans]|uniref:Carrier domain-containing protein n=1 Tax=Streptomyces hydrogenans TaxID=1873719 RepID=A0ABQ3P395_9ACTN|nr:DUF6284 family protein [Streptomyces hydrogenans]GHG12390.1 hypothetical protein GCM10018784_26540 [Streptomyces hydrogenans]GHI19483.1 hypothetical protein Shyd_08540 [Streptomyces hydrogenans]
MKSIAALQAVVTAIGFDGEPSDAELDAIEREMPLIVAELDLLDVEIWMLDRPATVLDERRIRRARNRVLDERRTLTNRAGVAQSGGAA